MGLVGSRGYFNCGYCGRFHFPEETDEGVAVLTQPAGAECPVCRSLLQGAIIEGQSVGYCGDCRGFLAPTVSFAILVNKRRERHTPNEERTEPFDRAELRRRVDCPGCGRPMQTHPYGGGGNAVVDTCDRCKVVWLDAGELAIIERYLPKRHRIEASLRLAPEKPDESPLSSPWNRPDVEDWWPF